MLVIAKQDSVADVRKSSFENAQSYKRLTSDTIWLAMHNAKILKKTPKFRLELHSPTVSLMSAKISLTLCNSIKS